jgi:hypothetical protein
MALTFYRRSVNGWQYRLWIAFMICLLFNGDILVKQW